MLNVKQEKFIQNIITGMSQREAYKDAYKVSYSNEAIDSKASALFNTDKVQERYHELIKQLEDTSIMSAKERMKWLTEVVNDIQREEVKVKPNNGEEFVIGKATASLDTKMKAIDILNKMDNQYVTKIDGTINSDININIELTDD